MMLLIAIGIAVLGSIIYGWWHRYHLGQTIFMSFFIGAMCIVVAGILISGVPNTSRHVDTSPLVALASGDKASGSFFLGSGTVDSEQMFSYIVDKGDYYLRRSVLADRSRIYIDEEPRVEVSEMCNDNAWFTPVTLCLNKRYDFYIPEGSILESYEVTP